MFSFVLFSMWIGKSNRFALNIKTDRREGKGQLFYQLPLHPLCLDPNVFNGKANPRVFPPAFPSATDENTKCLTTDGCQHFTESHTLLLLWGSHCSGCRGKTNQTCQTLGAMRNSSHARSASPIASFPEKKPGWLLAASPQNLVALNEMWRPILTRPQIRNCFSSA